MAYSKMNDKMKVYKAHLLFTREPNRFEVMENGYIAVENGCVKDVASSLAQLGCEECPVVDFGDRLLIPAMNDMHVHAPQYRNLGLALDLELLPWLDNYTFPEESKFADTRYAERMYRRFVRDLWRQGTMRSVCFATTHLESTRLLMHLFQEAGMGAMVGKVNMNRNCPDALCETLEEAERGCEALVHEFGDREGLVRPIVTPRFVPSCTSDMLRLCGDLARRYALPVQSHLSENKGEIEWVRELEPESRSYGDAYNRYGLFGQMPTIMAHCVWTEGEELALMQRNGVMVAHCPTSNLNISSGMAPVRTFLEHGIRVGLGSDISGGQHLSIFRMMVYAIQVSKMHYQRNHAKPFLTLSEAFWIATKSAGSFFGRVGSFEPGYEFDALVIDDAELNHDHYALTERLERFIYIGDDRHIVHRFCRGREVEEPKVCLENEKKRE